MKNILLRIVLFCCLPIVVFGQNKIKKYEYWMDNNVVGRQIVNISPTVKLELNASLPNSGLTPGLHTFNIRFCDDSNWCSAVSTGLIEAFTSSPQIVSFEYWFDSSYGAKTTVPLTPSATVMLNAVTLNASNLSDGMHLLNIRFLDASSKWSSVQSNLIYKSGSNSALLNLVCAYKYWIDDDFSKAITKAITPASANLNFSSGLDLSAFPKGNHRLNIQFKDTAGFWSLVSSQQIDIRFSNGTSSQNLMSEYRYWFGNNFSGAIEKPVIPQVAYATMNDFIDFSTVISGTKTLHFQFKDTAGLWSSVTTDTIRIIHAITANFSANSWGVCDSGNFVFTNTSTSFANSFKWDFGDSLSSKLLNVSHFYNRLGTYAVKLLAIDTITGIRDSVVKNIYVSTKPLVNLGRDTTIKSGQTLLLDAGNPGCTYRWSSGDTSRNLSVKQAGTYYVEVSNKGCLSTDTIIVGVNIGNSELINRVESVVIFPNPSSKQVSISVSLTFPEKVSLTLYNLLGEIIYVDELKCLSQNTTTKLDFTELPAGLYFIVLRGNSWTRTGKVLKSNF